MASNENDNSRDMNAPDDVVDAAFVVEDATDKEPGAKDGGYSFGPGQIPGAKTDVGGDRASDKSNGQAEDNASGPKTATGPKTAGPKTAGPDPFAKQRRVNRGPAPKAPKPPKPPKKPANTKALKRIVGFVLLVMIVLSVIPQAMYSIGETESVVLTTFGKASVVEEKGLHFKIPYVQQATRVDTTVKGLKIGYSESSDGQTVTVEHESIMITSDYNFIDCDFYVSYQVTDPVKYLYQSDEPDLIMKNIAMSCIRSTLSAYTVDTAITTGKAEIQSNVKSMIMAELEDKDIGITLVDASIQDVEPPTDQIIEAFTAVETAKQGKESSINQANAYRNEQIPAAEAEADRIKQEAEAKKTSRINEAKGQAARFEEEYAEYKNYPLITKQRMFMETMRDVLPKLKVIIDNGDGSVNKYYPITDLGTVGAEEIAAADGQ